MDGPGACDTGVVPSPANEPAPVSRVEGKIMPSGDPLSRRGFLAGISAVGGGLTLAFAIPFGPARAVEEAPEITAWLLICADNSIVVRIAHAEMGQGAQTGLAMLIAEELECDWAEVRTDFVSATENLHRGRIWGDMSTG